jgi:hypothetical protein
MWRLLVMSTDPRIRAAAASAAKQIKAEVNIHNARLEGIYRGFQQQVAAIQSEASADSLRGSSADPIQSPPN